jgi:signal transduction histidine kinase
MTDPAGQAPVGTTRSRRTRWTDLAVRLLGDPDTVELEDRILRSIMLIVVLVGVASTVQNLVLGYPLPMVFATTATAIAGGIAYLGVRKTKRWRLFVIPVFLFFDALLAYCWITEEGSHGTIGYYFFLLLVYTVLLFYGPVRIFFLLLAAATLAALLSTEYFFPEVLSPYPSQASRFFDVAFALPLCLATIAVFIHIVHREYQRERKARDQLLLLMTKEKERVERSMREKQRLLSVVCHDIANAVTVLEGNIALARLANRSRPANDRSDLDRMGYACGNIAEIIGSVRMIEAVEQGRVAFVLRPVDLAAVFQNAQSLFAERLVARNMRIRFPELTSETRFVMADPLILANQVFNNLISNAIKFSHKDAEIAVAVAHDSTETAVQVVDHGIGMPPDLVAKLFDVDAQITRPGTEGDPGTGFGLRTVKSFVDLFGGTMEIASRSEDTSPTDHGTTVTIRLKSCTAPG